MLIINVEHGLLLTK